MLRTQGALNPAGLLVTLLRAPTPTVPSPLQSKRQSLDASSAYLSKFTKAVAKLPDFVSGQPVIVLLKAKFYPDEPPLMVMIPLGALAAELDRRLPLADTARDLPRGRKRRGWKREFLKTLSDASADLEGVSEKQIVDAIRKVRSRQNKPELTVVAEAAETATT